MPLRKIADIPLPCLDQEHEPPKHLVVRPGLYEHECPSCGQIRRTTIPYVVRHMDGQRTVVDNPMPASMTTWH